MSTTCLDQRASQLLLHLKTSTIEQVEYMVSNLAGDSLLEHLEIIETMFARYIQGFKFISEVLISDKFFVFLRCISDWNILSTTQELMVPVYKIIKTFCRHQHERIKTMQEMGLVKAIVDLMQKEAEVGKIFQVPFGNTTVTTALMMSEFFPALRTSECYQDVNRICCGILTSGRSLENLFEDPLKEVMYALEMAFPTVVDLCQKPDSCFVHQVLLLKMIYWADVFQMLTEMVEIEILVNLVKDMLCSRQYHLIVLALAIVGTTSPTYLSCFKEESLCDALKNVTFLLSSTLADGYLGWAAGVYADLLGSRLIGDLGDVVEAFMIVLLDPMITLKLHLQTDLIWAMLKFIMPNVHVKSRCESSLSINYDRLSTFVARILKLPTNIDTHKGPFKVDAEGIRRFRSLVYFVRDVIDVLLRNNDECISDLQDKDLDEEAVRSPENIDLGLYESPTFDRVLGPSKSPEQLTNNVLVQALRLQSILYAVNEEWGTLFCILSSEKLLHRGHFGSLFLLSCARSPENYSLQWLLAKAEELSTDYRFLVPFFVRRFVFKTKLHNFYNLNESLKKPIKYMCSRQNIFTSVFENYQLLQDPKSFWEFQFIGELATGPGPTKEFYTEFSRDCQRQLYDLWIGETYEGPNGLLYVDSPKGLFPLPEIVELRNNHNLIMNCIGKIMAKSIMDRQKMDLNLSNAFFKYAFGASLKSQRLTLADIGDVLPSTYTFLQCLVDALKEKWSIINDDCLSGEEKIDLVSKITVDGCSFEDLCINFTVPGIPDLELKDGGYDELLSIDNVEEYLRLLVWLVLCEGPKQKFNAFVEAFDQYLPVSMMRCFYPDEIQEVICGVKVEHWSVEYLGEHCLLGERLSLETPVVRYLFEVLSSLTVEEQRDFLQFVTSNPRLPIGGLSALTPKLTITSRSSEGNPDMYLPSAMTCVNTLVVTHYSSKEALRERLLTALKVGGSFFSDL